MLQLSSLLKIIKIFLAELLVCQSLRILSRQPSVAHYLVSFGLYRLAYFCGLTPCVVGQDPEPIQSV